MDSDSEDSLDISEEQPESHLNCDCAKIHRVDEDEDDDEEESSFSRDPEDACWVKLSRLGVSINCASVDLVTVAVTQDDVMTLCHDHIVAINKHHCCHHCLTLVVMGTFLECPAGHRTDPLCNALKQTMEEEGKRSCSHCGSTVLREKQIQLGLEDSDESQVADFTKLIEELEKAHKNGVVEPRSVVDQWKERLRAVAPEVLIAFRHSPQKIGHLAARMYSVLKFIDDEELDLIEKLIDLRGVAKPGDIMSSVSSALESIWYEGELPFKYTDVVTDPDLLTEITDEKAIMFCECEGVCVPDTCNCCTGAYGIVDDETIINSIKPSMSPISECGPACGCRTDCGNRLVQSGGKRYPLELMETCDRGLGVRAKALIPKGRFIIEYTGRVRKIDNEDATNNYCFETILGLERVLIDARDTGSAARCVNHSCTPNAVIVKVAWEPVEERRLFHLAIFSLEDIVEGKEITIDYGDIFWIANMDEFACRCGSDGCRHHEEKRLEKLREFDKDNGNEETVEEEEVNGIGYEDEEDEEASAYEGLEEEESSRMVEEEDEDEIVEVGEDEDDEVDVEAFTERDEEDSEVNVLDV